MLPLGSWHREALCMYSFLSSLQELLSMQGKSRLKPMPRLLVWRKWGLPNALLGIPTNKQFQTIDVPWTLYPIALWRITAVQPLPWQSQVAMGTLQTQQFAKHSDWLIWEYDCMGIIKEAFPPLCKPNPANFYSADFFRVWCLIAVSNLHTYDMQTERLYTDTDL